MSITLKRKITKDTRTKAPLRFKPNMKVNGGLCIGFLSKVVVDTVNIKDNSKLELYRGMEIPRISFIFEGKVKMGAEVPSYIHSFMPPDVTDEDKFNKQWDSFAPSVKHFLEEHAKSFGQIDLTDDQYAMLELADPVDDTPVSIIAVFKDLYDNIKILAEGGEGKISVEDDKGKVSSKKVKFTSLIRKEDVEILLHIKLLLYTNGREVNRGNPGLPMYVGDGLIELFRENIVPNLCIRKEKGDSVEPKERQAVAPNNMPGLAGSPTQSGAGSSPADGGSTGIPGFLQ